MEQATISTPWFPVLLLIVIPTFFTVIHINVAINLYKFSKKYEADYGAKLFFMHPIVLAITGLMFGLLAALLSSLVLAVARR